jgi:predicted methyltransferase
MSHFLRVAFAALFLIGALQSYPLHAQDYKEIVAAPDRTAVDKDDDDKRQPVRLLEFIAPRSGWKVLDMAAGAGYSSELLARAVAPTGRVFAQHNKPSVMFMQRMKSPAMSNVTDVVAQADQLQSSELHDLDLVTFLFGYHDTTYVGIDRTKMNKQLFDSLKPGGTLVIADHSARPEDGALVGSTLHRIAQDTVKKEIEGAGFIFVKEGDFLRHPEDTRTEEIFKNLATVDNFILKFKRP